MFNEAKKVLDLIQPNDLVLDIGGASEVFPRANAVVDILPYEERTPGQLSDMPEQFTRDTWFVGDICTEGVWENFSDKQFDFVICSHTLEDIRDPLFVCQQMNRIGKAGYIEVPSKFRECCKAANNAIVTGWEHHRWLIEYVNDTLVFTAKLPYFTHFDFIGDMHRSVMYDYYRQFLSLHWNGSFNYTERVSKGSPVEIENLFNIFDGYLKDPVNPFYKADHVPFAGKTLEWLDEFKLPIEEIMSMDEIVKRYEQRCVNLNKITSQGQRGAFSIGKLAYNFLRRVKRRLIKSKKNSF
jgi:hypothetical protein